MIHALAGRPDPQAVDAPAVTTRVRHATPHEAERIRGKRQGPGRQCSSGQSVPRSAAAPAMVHEYTRLQQCDKEGQGKALKFGGEHTLQRPLAAMHSLRHSPLSQIGSYLFLGATTPTHQRSQLKGLLVAHSGK
jgi:hypothetical protein